MGWANSGRKQFLQEKQKEQRIAPLLLALYPPPGTSPTSYCMIV
jgi:hypothetical protein